MMKRTVMVKSVLAGSATLLWPAQAQAQEIHVVWVALAASPILAILISIVLSIVRKNWLIGPGSIALVALWVAWFAAASM